MLGVYLKRVKRAYSKAREIINKVEREVKETVIANAERKKAEDESKEMLKRMIEDSRKEKTGETLILCQDLCKMSLESNKSFNSRRPR